MVATKRGENWVHTGRWPYEPDYEIEQEDEPETFLRRAWSALRRLFSPR